MNNKPSAIRTTGADKRLRQRLKVVLLHIAEDPKSSREERAQATQHLIELTQYEEKTSNERSRLKLEEMKRQRAERAQINIERRKKKAAARAAELPPRPNFPEATGPNALGL
jgi:hypothetical protein